MTLFSSARGRIALALLLVGGVTYVLLLGSAFDHLGVPAVVGWRPSGETAPNSYSSSNSGSWSPAKAAADRINRLTDVTSVTLSPACAGWDPHAGEENDPPDCLRAKQFRELQTFKNLNYE